jgi:hypothetical protein
MAALYVVKLES